jgi:protein-arginine kinase activator protein McsA
MSEKSEVKVYATGGDRYHCEWCHEGMIFFITIVSALERRHHICPTCATMVTVAVKDLQEFREEIGDVGKD